jgi:hypothetical protein
MLEPRHFKPYRPQRPVTRIVSSYPRRQEEVSSRLCATGRFIPGIRVPGTPWIRGRVSRISGLDALNGSLKWSLNQPHTLSMLSLIQKVNAAICSEVSVIIYVELGSNFGRDIVNTNFRCFSSCLQGALNSASFISYYFLPNTFQSLTYSSYRSVL